MVLRSFLTNSKKLKAYFFRTSSWLRNNNNKVYLKNFQNGLQVREGESFQNHSQVFWVFEEVLHLLTLSHVHNRTITGLKWILPLNNQNNNKLINEAGSLSSSDSVKEENEIEKQPGRPIQRQIPQSQRGKAKTVHVKKNLSIASFSFRLFIQVSSQTAYNSCDFPLVYRKLH